MKLLTQNTGGNVHESAAYINALGLADYVLSIEFNGGYHSIVLMRVPNDFDFGKHIKEPDVQKRLAAYLKRRYE